MYIKNKKGQSTVEYVLLVTAVVAVIIAFSTGSNSLFKTQLNAGLCAVASDMNSLADTLSGSHGTQQFIGGPNENIIKVDVAKGALAGTGT